MSNIVVKIEKSGNRYNGNWDHDGNKFTSQITTGVVREYENGTGS